jgi:hypothetical protein
MSCEVTIQEVETVGIRCTIVVGSAPYVGATREGGFENRKGQGVGDGATRDGKSYNAMLEMFFC